MPESPAKPDGGIEGDSMFERRIVACRRVCGLTKREEPFTFESFRLTEENRRAAMAAREFAEKRDRNVMLWGLPGRGKTRLAVSAVNALVSAGVHARFWTATDLMIQLRVDSKDMDETAAIDQALRPEILVIDDFGVAKVTEWSLMMMDALFDRWYREGWTGLLLTSNLSPQEIAENISDRIASRIAEMCEVYEVKGKDWRVAR